MTLNGVMAVTLGYFTEFGKLVFRHRSTGNRVDLAESSYAPVYCVFSTSTICRRKESNSRSLSHLLMSSLFINPRLCVYALYKSTIDWL